ncbi:MAG: replication restart helicase PriA [Verrucomicrobiota bacterium]
MTKLKKASVVVDISLDREFDYLVPESLSARCRIGSRVVVPFGHSLKTGYIVGFGGSSGVRKLKEIADIEGDDPFLNGAALDLARWLADYYCAPLGSVIRSSLPGAVRGGEFFKEQLVVSLKPGFTDDDARGLSEKHMAVVDRLRQSDFMPVSELRQTLGISVSPIKTLQKKGLVNLERQRVRRNPFFNRRMLRTGPLSLMPEQKKALDAIVGNGSAEERGFQAILLYGLTGSGKTEVDLQEIAHFLERGKGAIMLVPEISLTPQTVERFTSRFGERVAVLHSHLSRGERHDEWHRIKSGEADIVIGARSAVFAPLRNVGVIVVDEEHETSYKQEETPRYGARDVAVVRGKMENCPVVLGSATPSMESWQNVRKGKYALAKLTRRVDNRQMPLMRVIDMRMEAQREGRPNVFSRDLLNSIDARLDRGEQVILFLNRRGYATSMICPKCGYVAECGNCSVAYTYHRKDEMLRCHVCGAARRLPDRCPGCADPAFKFAGIGTQRVERIINKCFPAAKIERLDADVTRRKDTYDRVLGDFRAGRINILLGTQMIAKGLHFPNVTLVGVIYADLSLHVADFRAGERTFQLLAQVAGRAGRGEVTGEVIVQTYTPHHPAVQAARRLDFEGFADQELEFRKELSYPPFSHLVCITVKGPVEEQVSFYISSLAERLKKMVPARVIISDPTPAPLAKAKGRYRYQLMLRAGSTASITAPLRKAVNGFNWPGKVNCVVDVDPVGLM